MFLELKQMMQQLNMEDKQSQTTGLIRNKSQVTFQHLKAMLKENRIKLRLILGKPIRDELEKLADDIKVYKTEYYTS